MKNSTGKYLNKLFDQYPKLIGVKEEIITVFEILLQTFSSGGKLLVCGNGGSSADADHIVGELMKGFLMNRPIGKEIADNINGYDSSGFISSKLQLTLPAINLSAHNSLVTAICNDTSSDMIFAQQVIGYGQVGDVLLGISTSGNSSNVIYAGKTAKALNMKTIGLTGADGGFMDGLFDIVIKVPEHTTVAIQELHLPVYHALCAMLEEEFFRKDE